MPKVQEDSSYYEYMVNILEENDASEKEINNAGCLAIIRSTGSLFNYEDDDSGLLWDDFLLKMRK